MAKILRVWIPVDDPPIKKELRSWEHRGKRRRWTYRNPVANSYREYWEEFVPEKEESGHWNDDFEDRYIEKWNARTGEMNYIPRHVIPAHYETRSEPTLAPLLEELALHLFRLFHTNADHSSYYYPRYRIRIDNVLYQCFEIVIRQQGETISIPHTPHQIYHVVLPDFTVIPESQFSYKYNFIRKELETPIYLKYLEESRWDKYSKKRWYWYKDRPVKTWKEITKDKKQWMHNLH